MAMRKLKKYKQTKFRARGSKYNKDAADFAVAFIESLCHTKGTWAGKKFELIDWQGADHPGSVRNFEAKWVPAVQYSVH